MKKIGKGKSIDQILMRKFYVYDMDLKKERNMEPEQIRKGDIFRIDEADGTPVIFNNCNFYIAWKDAIPVPKSKGRCTIFCFELPNDKVKEKKTTTKKKK